MGGWAKYSLKQELCAVDSYGFDGILQPHPQTGLEEKPVMKLLENYLTS